MTYLSEIGIASATAGLVLLSAPGLTAQTTDPAPLPQAALVAQLKTTVDSLARLDQFSGVVVLIKGDVPVFEGAWGMADREAGRRINLETAFNLGSINKIFTRTAIHQLAAEGRIALDSTLATYWPDYRNAEVARRVTIGQLLEHSSGIGGNIFGAPAGGTRHDVRHNRDYLPLFVQEPLRFAPGTREAYSNAGYVVLGLLVERLSGEDYYQYVDRHIYRPAGMTRTAAWPADSLPGNTALGYTRGENNPPSNAPLRRNTELLPGRGSSAGGGYSTAGDLARFLRALRERKIPAGPPPGIGAAGGTVGVNAVVEGDLRGGYDLIVLSNLDPPSAERLSRMIRGWLGALD
jgi:CubicO group peptidase (beta-lactamase class C family)